MIHIYHMYIHIFPRYKKIAYLS